MFGFYRLAAAVPVLRVADTEFNLTEMLRLYREAAGTGADAVVFPELSLTGCSCGDLFFQKKLLDSALEAARQFAAGTSGYRTIAVFGIPLLWCDRLYNAAAVVSRGKIVGIVPKTLLPNHRECSEKRQFSSGREIAEENVVIGETPIPFGTDLVFDAGGDFKFGIEIGEDLQGVLPPSSLLALAGARVIFNLSGETELAGKADYRKQLVAQQSGRCLAAYVLAGAGVYESTTDAVYGGHALIGGNGRINAESNRFRRKSQLIFADLDLARLGAARFSESTFADNPLPPGKRFRQIVLEESAGSPDLRYAALTPHPFIPENLQERRTRCQEIFDIQCAGLAKRLEHTHAKTLVIGISGGLDSTLALLVAAGCCKLLDRPASDILAFTMPGFGTTGRTRSNAAELCRLLGVTLREVPIKEACLLHFRDIGHDPEVLDVTYENVQARERTQILMDAANKTGGLVIGTGDLSEIALGWSTYNGDHMSMYAVNCSIPKTLIRFLIENAAGESEPALAKVLRDVIDTPVSPELLPADKLDQISQKTEDLVGPYELHDFFLYHFLKYGAEPEKLLALAKTAFAGSYEEAVIRKWLKKFLQRFFTQQFKRSCVPDGPKAGTIALSPRGDWRMPSDSWSSIWLKEL